MARFSAGVLTGAGSTTLPIISLYAGATGGATIREISLSNSTSSSVDLKLVRLTSAGTQGAGLTEAKHNPNSGPALCSAFTTHAANPGLGDDLGYRISLGAAEGAAVIWTFGDDGLVVPVGTSNGIGVIVENGSGTPIQADIVWDE